MPPEELSIEERLERAEQAIAQIQVEEHQRIARNSVAITIVRYTLVGVLGGVGLVAAVLSGAEYEGRFGDNVVAFHGTEFKGALQIFAGIAATGTGFLGFGDRLLKGKGEDA